MTQNVGTVDAYMRITGGLCLLGWGVARAGRRPDFAAGLLVALGAMKVAEGVTRFCPMLAAMGISSVEGLDEAALEMAQSME